MTSVSKNVYIDKLDVIVDEYNKTKHRTIKMKPFDVKDNIYIYIYIYILTLVKKLMIIILNLKLVIMLRISKCKNIVAKGYTPNWSEKVFVMKEIKNTVPWTYVINDPNGKEIIGTFYKNELQKTNQEEFRIEKVIKKKGDKLYVFWWRH